MRRHLALPLAFAMILGAAACGSDDGSSDRSDTTAGAAKTDSTGATTVEEATDAGGGTGGDGTIAYAFSVSPDTLDPDRVTSGQAALYLMPVYDRLVQIDPVTSELHPMLATEWTIGSDADGDFAEFTLRKGLTFPDGASFNADTVIANVDRSLAAEGFLTSRDLAAATSVEKVDSRTVRVRTEGGAGWVPAVMGSSAGMMISQDSIDNDDLATVPVGIGMWTLERYDPSVVNYTATEDYWDADAQAAERLELHHIPDDSARFNAVRSGDLDLTFIRPNQVDDVDGAGLNLVRSTGATTYAIALNTAQPGLDQPAARQALQHAIDRQAIADELLVGECEPAGQPWSAAWPAHNPDISAPVYDPELAKELLAEAGYPDGFEIEFAAYDIDQYRRLAEIVQAQWAQIGVQVNLEIMPAAGTREAFGIRQDVAATQSTPGLDADPSQLVSLYWLPDSPMNPGGLEYDGLAALATKALGESDPNARSEMYQQIASLTAEGSNLISICSPNFMYATNDTIAGFEGGRAAGAPEWRGVSG